MKTDISTSTSLTLSIVESEPRIDSRIVATELGVEHKATIQLVDKYSSQFQELGQLPFEMEVVTGNNGGGNPKKFALLNEDQTYFLMTLVRNTAQAVELKKRLVTAFSAARKQLAVPNFDDPIAAAEAWIKERKEKIAATKALEAAQPAIELQEELMRSEKAAITLSQAAQMLPGGHSQSDVRRWMVDQRWIYQARGGEWMVYKSAYKNGLVRLQLAEISSDIISPYPVLTGKGFLTLRSLLAKNSLFLHGIDASRLLPAPTLPA